MHGVLNVRAIFFSLILVKRKKKTKKERVGFFRLCVEGAVRGAVGALQQNVHHINNELHHFTAC